MREVREVREVRHTLPSLSRLTMPPYTPAPTTSIGKFQPIWSATLYGIGCLFQRISLDAMPRMDGSILR